MNNSQLKFDCEADYAGRAGTPRRIYDFNLPSSLAQGASGQLHVKDGRLKPALCAGRIDAPRRCRINAFHPSSFILHLSRAFTLVEIMVVVIIIAIILALAITGWNEMIKTTHGNNTRMMLKELSSIATDYHTRTGNFVKTGNYIDSDITDFYPLNGDVNSPVSIQYFINQVYMNAPKTAKLFGNINPKFVIYKTVNINGKPVTRVDSFIDSWGNYIRYTSLGYMRAGLPRRQSGKTSSAAYQTNPTPYFASAGADGLWGQYNKNGDGKPNKDAKDNEYSFNLKSHKNEGGS